MPRAGSGAFSLVAGNPVVEGTDIEPDWANDTLSDVAAEITNSLDRAGRGSMSGELKLADGAVGAPALTFNSDSDTGFYRISANRIGIAAGGTLIGYIDGTTGLVIPGSSISIGGASFNPAQYAKLLAPAFTGAASFGGTVTVPTPASNLQAANKLYVDTADQTRSIAGPKCSGRVVVNLTAGSNAARAFLNIDGIADSNVVKQSELTTPTLSIVGNTLRITLPNYVTLYGTQIMNIQATVHEIGNLTFPGTKINVVAAVPSAGVAQIAFGNITDGALVAGGADQVAVYFVVI